MILNPGLTVIGLIRNRRKETMTKLFEGYNGNFSNAGI